MSMEDHRYVVCVDNEGFEVSLEVRKLYEVLIDLDAEKYNQIRIIDESGEDYLYPAEFFDFIMLPATIAERVFQAHG